jgi:hypothetical protein
VKDWMMNQEENFHVRFFEKNAFFIKNGVKSTMEMTNYDDMDIFEVGA